MSFPIKHVIFHSYVSLQEGKEFIDTQHALVFWSRCVSWPCRQLVTTDFGKRKGATQRTTGDGKKHPHLCCSDVDIHRQSGGWKKSCTSWGRCFVHPMIFRMGFKFQPFKKCHERINMIKFQTPKVVQGFFHPQYGGFLSHGGTPKSSKLDYFSIEIHRISLFARNPWDIHIN